MKVKISLCIPTYKMFDTFLKKNVEIISEKYKTVQIPKEIWKSCNAFGK